jgi:hypothetical protein
LLTGQTPVPGQLSGQIPAQAGQPPGSTQANSAASGQGKNSAYSALFFDSKSPNARKILFVGNNITSNNQLPITLAAMMLGSKPPMEVRIGEVVKAGATLETLLLTTEACAVIRNDGPWTDVVLQEQSENALVAPDSTLRSGALFSRLIQSVGARPIVFETWCHVGKIEDQYRLKDAYTRLAVSTGGTMVPVGEAFDLCRRRHPEINLYSDDRHPNQLGTYLSACVMYVKLFGRTPIGLPCDLSFPDPRTHERLQIMSLKPNLATVLQQIALQAQSGN